MTHVTILCYKACYNTVLQYCAKKRAPIYPGYLGVLNRFFVHLRCSISHRWNMSSSWWRSNQIPNLMNSPSLRHRMSAVGLLCISSKHWLTRCLIRLGQQSKIGKSLEEGIWSSEHQDQGVVRVKHSHNVAAKLNKKKVRKKSIESNINMKLLVVLH